MVLRERIELSASALAPAPSLDLPKQRDQCALAMCARLGKDGFQLIARRLPGNLQLSGGDIGRGAAGDDARELRLRRCQSENFG